MIQNDNYINNNLNYIINYQIVYYINCLEEFVKIIYSGIEVKVINENITAHDFTQNIIYYNDDYKYNYYSLLNIDDDEKLIKILEINKRLENKIIKNESVEKKINNIRKKQILKNIINLINNFNNSLPLEIKNIM